MYGNIHNGGIHNGGKMTSQNFIDIFEFIFYFYPSPENFTPLTFFVFKLWHFYYYHYIEPKN